MSEVGVKAGGVLPVSIAVQEVGRGGVQIYPPLFVALVVYSVGGTAASLYLGRNLVGLNFQQEAQEANYRWPPRHLAPCPPVLSEGDTADLNNCHILNRLTEATRLNTQLSRRAPQGCFRIPAALFLLQPHSNRLCWVCWARSDISIGNHPAHREPSAVAGVA